MQQRCVECHKENNQEQMIQFGDDWICHDCKHSYVQALEKRLEDDYGTNQCQHCGAKRSLTMKQYFQASPLGEYQCSSCNQFSKVDTPRWVGRLKFIVFLLTMAAFYVGATFITHSMESFIGRLAVFLGAILAFVPSALFIQIFLGKVVFQRFTRLLPMTDVKATLAATLEKDDNSPKKDVKDTEGKAER